MQSEFNRFIDWFDVQARPAGLLRFAVGYVLCALAGNYLSVPSAPFSNPWLPSGLFVAVLLRHESRQWLTIIATALVAHLIFDWLTGKPLSTGLVFATSHGVEAVCDAWLMRKFVAARPDLATAREVIGLLAAALAGATLGATLTVLAVTSMTGQGVSLVTWFLWISGNTLGVVLIAPLLLGKPLQILKQTDSLVWARRIEMGVLALVACAIAIVTFHEQSLGERLVKYWIIPCVLWVAIRFDVRITALTNLVIALLAAWTSSHGSDPENYVSLQPFLIESVMAGLVIAAVITERKQAEMEVMESEERFTTVFREAPVWMAITDMNDATYVDVNEHALTASGFTREEVIGRTAVSVGWLTADDRARLLQELADHGRIRDLEVQFHTKTGQSLYGWVSGKQITLRGRPHLLTVSADITELKQKDAALRESVALMDATLSVAPVGIARLRDRVLLEVSAGLANMLGYRREELIGQPSRILYPTDDDYHHAGLGYAAIAADNRVSLETRFLTRDKRVIEVTMACVWLDPDDRDAGIVAAVMDISERKRAEVALHESEVKFATAFNTSSALLLITGPDGKIVEVNQSWCALFGYTREEVVGKSLVELGMLSKADREKFVAALARSNGELNDVEQRVHMRDGSFRDIIYSTKVILLNGVPHNLSTSLDITERKALQEQLRQSQKLEAIGTLAGGIAHDFNNILSGILGFTALARQASDGNDQLRNYLEHIERAGRRAVELVTQILAFSRTSSPAQAPLQLRNVVSEAANLLRAAIPSSVEFDIRLDTDVPAVLGNASQLHQVVMNLGTNAWHAMREQPGRLRILLQRCEIDATQAALLSDISPGTFVHLTVADTGCGMDAATSARVFDPFFTTKARGEGTGLGLSVVHGIVLSHNGAIRLHSEVGHGTTVEIFLPAIVAEPQPDKGVAHPVQRGHGERILFVDDEEALVSLGGLMLQRLGYIAVTESRVLQALARLENDPQYFQLVVTDHSMPGLTGLDFAARIHALRPDLPILLTSGYSAALTAERIKAAGVREVLSKPYTEAELAAAIHRQLTSVTT